MPSAIGTSRLSRPKTDESGPGTGTTVRLIQTLEGVEALRATWTAFLGHRDADIDVYQTILRRRPVPTAPHIVLIERGGRPDAILVGEASTTRIAERIAYLTFPVTRVRVLNFVYGAFLGNQSEENSRLIISELERSLRHGDADLAILNYVREDTPLYQVASRLPSAMMRDHFPTAQAHSLMVLPDRPEDIYARLSSEHRWKLRRDAKRLRAAFPELRVDRFVGLDRLQQMTADTERVAATTYQRGLGVGFSDTEIIRELLGLEATKGWLRGYILYLGEQPCAFWIGCVYNGVFLSEYLGHDPAYAKNSPGTYLLAHAMEELCREGVKAIDFSIGGSLYKQRFGNQQWNESTLYLYAPRWRGLRVKALRTAAVLINSTAKKLLEKTNLEGRVKKLWRKRVTQEHTHTEAN